MHRRRTRSSMNKLTWTRMNTEHFILLLPPPTSPSSLSFSFCPHIFSTLCTRSINTRPPSLCLSFSFSYVYLFVTSPPSALWLSPHYTQLVCIIIICSPSLPPLTTVTITVMYDTSQLFQHEQRRKKTVRRLLKANSEF